MSPSVLIESPENNRRFTRKDDFEVARYLEFKSLITSKPSRDVQFDIGEVPAEALTWIHSWTKYSAGYEKNDNQRLGTIVKVEERHSIWPSDVVTSYDNIGIEGGRRFFDIKHPNETLACRYWYEIPPSELPDGETSHEVKPPHENEEFRKQLEVPPTVLPPLEEREYTITNGKADTLETIPECLRMACLLETYEVAVLPREQLQVDAWIKGLKLDVRNPSPPFSDYQTAGYLDGHGFVTYKYTDQDDLERTHVIFRDDCFSSYLIDAGPVEGGDQLTTTEQNDWKDPWVDTNEASTWFRWL
jgi:hypothetical protein